MGKVGIWIIIAISFICKVDAQSYVKFAEAPKMELNAAKQFNNYSIEYNTHTKSTIYLELKKGDQLIGNSVYEISKPGKKVVRLNIIAQKNIESIPEGANYSYNLYMYEGGRNDWSTKACKTLVVEGVRMKKIKYSKPSLINTFN